MESKGLDDIFFFNFFFFDFGFMALSRLFHSYQAYHQRWVKTGEPRELGFPTSDQSEAQTTAVRNLMD